MKNPLLILAVSITAACLLPTSAKPKRAQAVAAAASPTTSLISVGFEPISYSEGGFHGTRLSLDLAYITSDFPDGIQAPLPFFLYRSPETTDHQFRETIIFVVDNLSEAYHN